MNHTGIELQLMLAKKKPLAMFYCSTFKGVEYEVIPEEEFEPYVKSGQFVKDEFILLAGDPRVSVRYVLYALKGEEWRIPALKLVLRQQPKTGGRAAQEGIDRITGALLGYTEEEIEEHIKQSATIYSMNASGPLAKPSGSLRPSSARGY